MMPHPMGAVLSILLAGAVLGAGPIDRPYKQVPLEDLSINSPTHVCVTGRVTLVRREADGDTHISLNPSIKPKKNGANLFIVAEIIPRLPVELIPKVGQVVNVCGIQRWDAKHRFMEVHPVETITVLK